MYESLLVVHEYFPLGNTTFGDEDKAIVVSSYQVVQNIELASWNLHCWIVAKLEFEVGVQFPEFEHKFIKKLIPAKVNWNIAGLLLRLTKIRMPSKITN